MLLPNVSNLIHLRTFWNPRDQDANAFDFSSFCELSKSNTRFLCGHWIAAHCDTTVARMLVGNKCDLDNIREVSKEEGKALAEEEGLFFMETSALDSTNVQISFEIVIREIFKNVSRKVLNSDSYKAELSVNRVTLVKNGADSKGGLYSCCG